VGLPHAFDYQTDYLEANALVAIRKITARWPYLSTACNDCITYPLNSAMEYKATISVGAASVA
jgi:hypothetical protein